MNTKRILFVVFALLGALSAGAYWWKPRKNLSGKTPLVWVSDNNPARAQQIATFNGEHPDLRLELDYGNAAAGTVGVQKIILQCSSGVGPDIFDFRNDFLQTYVEAGVIWDVTEAAEKAGFSAGQTCWPGGRDAVSFQGRQYGYSCNIGTSILVYNKNVFDFFGVPYPKDVMTWEEFVELAARVNSRSVSGSPAEKPIYAISGASWRIFFENQHGEYFTEDGALNIANSPELRIAFQMHKDFIFKHRFMPSTVELKSMSGQGVWASGLGNLNQFVMARFAMVVTGHWALIAFSRAYQNQLDYLKSQGISEESITNPLERPLRIGATLIPRFAGRDPCYGVSGRVAGINARSPRRQEALEFLQYLAGPAYSTIVNEGTDWLPGNPRYADLGVKEGPPVLAGTEMHDATKKAMSYGYVQRNSPFLLSSDVLRVLADQINRMESDPSLSVENLLQTAEKQLKTLIRRNLERSPDLKKLYVERLGEDALRNLP